MFGSRLRDPERYFTGAQLDLARAIAKADADAVRALAPRTDLNAVGARGMTLLMFALLFVQRRERAAELAVVTELVRAGADALHEVPELGSALSIAALWRSPGLLRALLDGGVSANARLGGDTPVLARAANEINVANMRLLLDRGADVNASNSLGNPPLLEALYALQLDQVVELLDRGADPRAVNLLGSSFANILETLMGRQVEGSPGWRKMGEIRDRIVREGLAWPPASAEVERDRMRARGVEPIVPYGCTR